MDTITNIPVSSLTYALKGQKVLERYGYKAWAGRDHNRVSGCGYQLTVRGDPEKAKELLVQYGICLVSQDSRLERSGGKV